MPFLIHLFTCSNRQFLSMVMLVPAKHRVNLVWKAQYRYKNAESYGEFRTEQNSCKKVSYKKVTGLNSRNTVKIFHLMLKFRKFKEKIIFYVLFKDKKMNKKFIFSINTSYLNVISRNFNGLGKLFKNFIFQQWMF